MNGGPISAWQFVHPDFDPETAATGLQISARGGVALASGDAAVRQAILLLLSTAPGERVMRPEYGCRLNALVFAPNDATTAGLAIHYVRRAIERWEPRVEVLAVDANAHPEQPNLLVIWLSYRLRASARTDQLVLPVALGA